MIELGIGKGTGLLGKGVLAVTKHAIIDKLVGTASEMAVAQVTQQLPRWGGLTPDDEALLAIVDTGLETHFPGDLAKVLRVREALTTEENRRWRMGVVVVKLDGLQTIIPDGKKTEEFTPPPKGSPAGTASSLKKRLVEAVTVPVRPLSKDDPRVLHLHYVASLVKEASGPVRPGESLPTYVGDATRYLRSSFLNDDSFVTRIRLFLKEAWIPFSENVQEGMELLGNGTNKAFAFLILDSEEFEKITTSRSSEANKMKLLMKAMRRETQSVHEEIKLLEGENFLKRLWRYKWWFAPLVVMAVLYVLT